MLLGRHERWIFELECESVEAAEIWVERRIQELLPRLRCSSSIGGWGARRSIYCAACIDGTQEIDGIEFTS